MNRAWRRIVAPTANPIDDLSIFDHLRVTQAANEPAAVRALEGAVSWIETYLQRGLVTQTWTYAQDVFTDAIQLPMAAPLQSVSSVKYYDAAGVDMTLSTSVYLEDTLSDPGRIYLAPAQVWPVVQSGRPLAVRIEYVVGWDDPAEIPADILDGIYLLAGDRYEHREQTVTGTIQARVLDVERMLAGRRIWVPPVNSEAWLQEASR